MIRILVSALLIRATRQECAYINSTDTQSPLTASMIRDGIHANNSSFFGARVAHMLAALRAGGARCAW